MSFGGYQSCLLASTVSEVRPRKDKRGVDLISDVGCHSVGCGMAGLTQP